MLSILDGHARLCDRLTRRESLRVGALSLFGGLSLPRLLAAREASNRPAGRVKSVIVLNLLGGPSHLDMFDLKPHAPPEVRGEFSPIASSLVGEPVCEHMPKIAQWMHRATLIRTVTHSYNAHNPLAILTGYALGDPAVFTAAPSDPPDIGAICQYLGMGPSDVPGAVCMPCYPGWGEGIRRPGPYGGYLGSQYDPLFTLCNPTFDRKPRRPHYDPVMPKGAPFAPSLDPAVGMTIDRLHDRRRLLDQVDQQFHVLNESPALDRLGKFERQAFALLATGRTRDAFDIDAESAQTRERYGPSLTGSSLLLARRLVEAEVTFVSVHAEIFGSNGHSYDMHENNFGMLKDYNLPILDTALPALLTDLSDRRLWDSTLLLVTGEMGRSPRINAAAGRDHWPQCGFALLFGGGLREGHVHGASDRMAAYPARDPVSPGDLVATIYHLLGIDPEMTVPDMSGRPMPISHGGVPIAGILA